MYEIDLIEAVKKHDCIYDRNSIHFKNKLVKRMTWDEIARTVGTDVKHCQARWRSLRDRFVKEAKKIPNSECGADDECQWTFFEALTFLKPHIQPPRIRSKSRSNTVWPRKVSMSSPVPSETMLTEPEQQINFQDVHSPTTETEIPPRIRVKRFREDNESERFDKLLHIMSNINFPSEQPSKHKAFLSMVDEYLNKLPDEQVEDIKFQVLSFLYKRIRK